MPYFPADIEDIESFWFFSLWAINHCRCITNSQRSSKEGDAVGWEHIVNTLNETGAFGAHKCKGYYDRSKKCRGSSRRSYSWRLSEATTADSADGRGRVPPMFWFCAACVENLWCQGYVWLNILFDMYSLIHPLICMVWYTLWYLWFNILCDIYA